MLDITAIDVGAPEQQSRSSRTPLLHRAGMLQLRGRLHLGCTTAGDGQLLDIVHGGVQVHLVLGSGLPPLILRLRVLACSTQQSELQGVPSMTAAPAAPPGSMELMTVAVLDSTRHKNSTHQEQQCSCTRWQLLLLLQLRAQPGLWCVLP